MKSSIWFIIALSVVLVAGGIYLASHDSQPVKDLVETILPVKTESPYSLKWGSELARVVDQDGNGVPEASVTFTKYLGQDCNGNTTEEPPEWQGVTVTTNEEGEFSCPSEIWQAEEGKNRPSIYAKIEATGFLPRSGVGVGVNYGDDSGEIDLFRIGRIEGVIIDPNGQPIANAPIWFNTHTQYKHPNSSCGGCFSANVKTDKAGGFVLEKVPLGLHVVKFPGHAGGCGPEEKVEKIPFKEYATFQMIDMKDGEVRSDVFLDLRQSRGAIAGKVVDKFNRPMAGVRVFLFKEVKRYFKDGWSSYTENVKYASTDENGDYVLSHIPSGDYQIQAQYPYEKGKNYKSGDPLNIYLAGKQDVAFNLVLERQDDSLPKPDNRKRSLFKVPLPKDLRPRDMMIVDPRGNGVAGASVIFDKVIKLREKDSNQTTKMDWEGASLTTDSRGVFVLPKALESLGGKWAGCRVTIKAEGFEQRHAWLGSWNLKEDRRIDILPLSEIRGQLIGIDGKPVKGNISMLTQLTAYHNPGSSGSGGSGGIQATGKDGRFAFKAPEGTQVLQYEVLNFDKNSQHVGNFVIYTQGGKPVDDLIIDLREDTCAIHGRVLDADGKPVKKATVRLIKSVQWGHDHFGKMITCPEFYRSEKTDRKGNYIIKNIRPGVYEIEAVLEGKQQRTSEKMTIVVSDGQAIELDVRLKR